MGIESPEGAFHLQPGRDHHPVHIDRPRLHAQRRQHARDHGRVDGLQQRDGRHRESLQPSTRGPRRGYHLDLTEPSEQRIILQKRQVSQPSAADDQQRDQHAHHGHGAEVAPPARPATRMAHRRVEPGAAQVAAQQLQPGIRRERHVRERQIPIDSGSQIGSASSHVRWPFVAGVKGWLAPLFNHNGRPFSISK
jgi:hypothetical protein